MTQHRSLLTTESLVELTAVHQAPCLSLYQPTYWHRAENQQDLISFRNLVKTMETSLRQKYPTAETNHFLQRFEALEHDRAFWNNSQGGLAVFGGAGLFRVFQVSGIVPELAVVANSFHTKPLRRVLQSGGRYHILGLSLGKIQLYEGDRNGLFKLEPIEGIPTTIKEALGDELTDSHQTVSSHGGVDGTPTHHTQGGKKDETDKDTERFFRIIDREVLNHYSRPSGLPLLLAALPEHHHLFHKISKNPFLMPEGLLFNPEGLTIAELQQRAWKIQEAQHQTWLTTHVTGFMEAKALGLGSDNLAEVAKAAVHGRIAMLLLESNREIFGRLNSTTGDFELADPLDPQVDDLLDDLGERVEKMGGKVLLIPTEQMPGKTGLAATYRY